jgi:hypothetical protein
MHVTGARNAQPGSPAASPHRGEGHPEKKATRREEGNAEKKANEQNHSGR